MYRDMAVKPLDNTQKSCINSIDFETSPDLSKFSAVRLDTVGGLS
jgi:hypothetical protein